ncbi:MULTISPECIES: type IV toxin-antitoxin system AbiEi family antitoxin [unclassified Arcicella]|uniref:type IV toxin-antitoxin system AbiEi family antitoxin n=1 Tax=unclassified Arcicella TaxID=2644986 RepID=UPI00285ED3AA|nr:MULTISPECIES: type IV toxin-antitoxin system AbiEi family antitoxin [unclassified Arcicella]MDR6560797.1 hypothetical protein [Arcicella sp. BE51]MDR6810681.1 hypothetical protein [Arcicella sp. BE140]MDR6822031.1 hypothetical protein [Arcicella sp. BE139]
MKEYEITQLALENLEANIGVAGNWNEHGIHELDGTMELIIDQQLLKFNVEVKQELRNHQLAKIIEMEQRYGSLMVVANRIFPNIKQELRQNQIAYLEANGNIWLKQSGILLWIDNQKTLQEVKDKGNRAFSKTGLKVVFHFLLDENTINRPYREIANITEVSLGNINYVITGLKEMGYLIKLSKDQYKLTNKKDFLDKWITNYEERLKPSLKIGSFRFLKENDFNNWRNIGLQQNTTLWGGEPAGDILTNYLNPAELTIYTDESRSDLMKKYRLLPDPNGKVHAYKKFWKSTHDGLTVPPILVYADLINQHDRRCNETAEKIKEKYLYDTV